MATLSIGRYVKVSQQRGHVIRLPATASAFKRSMIPDAARSGTATLLALAGLPVEPRFGVGSRASHERETAMSHRISRLLQVFVATLMLWRTAEKRYGRAWGHARGRSWTAGPGFLPFLPRFFLIRTGFGSASFGRMNYAPSTCAGVPAACAQDA